MSDSQSQDVRIVAVKTARGRLQPLEEIDLVSDSDSDETYFEGAEDRGPAIVEEDYHHHDGLHPHLELDVLDMELEAVEQRHPHLELEVLDMELEAMECDEEVEGGQNFWENLLTDGEESEDVHDLDSDSDETYFEDAEDRGPAIVEEDYHPHGLGHQHDLELEVNPEAHEELHRQDDLVLEVDLDALLDSHEYDEEVEGGQNFWENLLTDGEDSEDSEDDDGHQHDLELEVNPEAHEELHRQDDLELEVDLDALLDSHEYDEEVEGGQNFWENLLTDGEDSEDDDGYESASQADTE